MTDILPPDAPDDTMIFEAVRFINDKVAVHVFNGSLEIGQYVLERFFNNDITLAGARNVHKPVSYSRLCQHPDLSVARTTLMNMVKTAAQEQFLMAGGIAVDRLNYSQKVYLTRLENNAEKLALATACIDEGWTTRELKQRIQEVYLQSTWQPVTVGDSLGKYLTGVRRWLGRVQAPEGMTSYGYVNGNLSLEEKETILAAASGMLEEMTAATNAIRQLVTILSRPPMPPIMEGDPPEIGT